MRSTADSFPEDLAIPRAVIGHTHPIELLLNGNGEILSISRKWKQRYSSMVEELAKAGNVRSFFDLSAYPALDKIPGIVNLRDIAGSSGKSPVPVSFYNHRPFAREEDPEPFYTSVPTAQLYVAYKSGADRFIAFIRAIDTLPSLYPTRPDGIIYIDSKGWLAGFNRSFYSFFSAKYAAPSLLLNKPASLFLEPSPFELQRTRLSKLVLPSSADLRTEFRYSAGESPAAKDISFSHPDNFSVTEKGLLCENREVEDLIFLTLPCELDTRRDFTFTLDATTLEGVPPLFIIGREFAGKTYPDTLGYLAGPHPDQPLFSLKRRGVVHFLGENITAEKRSLFTLYKIGNSLFLYQGRQKKLAYYDFDFLHHPNARLTVAIRTRSSCLVHDIRVGIRAAGDILPPPSLPVIKLKTMEQNYFSLNQCNLNSLSTSFPHLSAYILQNITEIQKQVNSLKTERQLFLPESGGPDGSFICRNQAMVLLKKKAALLALSDASVLIEGETGTGKEVLATFIHSESGRREGPFIKVDCATIPQELIESELFGHEKGAFTGAAERRIGLFEEAEGGTLFLDEVGNLSLPTQAKLLHFLQDHTITRLGGAKPVKVDARVIVASNTPLASLVRRGAFRPDLFYRMDVVALTLPPLRERPEDLPELCSHFILSLSSIHRKNIQGLSPAAFRKILGHTWPGNVRELKNTLERAVIFCEGRVIGPLLVSFTDTVSGQENGGKRNYRFISARIPEIQALFRKHGFVAKAVARELGVSARTLYYHLKRNGRPIGKIRKAADKD
jgi:DNA-binding NtrC family response regulator